MLLQRCEQTMANVARGINSIDELFWETMLLMRNYVRIWRGCTRMSSHAIHRGEELTS